VTSRLRPGGALVLTAGALLLTLSGCGSAGEPDSADPAATRSAATGTASTGTAGTATAGASTTSSTGPPALEASGTVEQGVEAGCLVLRPEGPGSGELWTLTGEVGDLRPGQRVTVRGSLRPDAVSFCQQGQVFEVAVVLPG
jgi:hypothetical protein